MNILPFHRPQSLARELVASLSTHAWLTAIVLVHATVAYALYQRYPGQYHNILSAEDFAISMFIGPLFYLCAYALYVMVRVRPARLVHYLTVNIRAYLTRERIMHALPVLVMIPVFSFSFTIVKAAVPMLHPFDWDTRLAALDQNLHGGIEPWVWLQSVAGHPVITAILNLAYHLWFFILFAIVFWLAFSMERPRLRMQFLLAFVLTWIVMGNVLATCFASVGPCYYGYVVPGPNPYAGLMHYLHQADQTIPVLALDVQHLLWNDYAHHIGASGLSISAMPSMHVASATLLALLGWRLSRAAGIALTLFAILIQVGSIHLGWHYAVDGYAGALGAILIWLGIGRLLAPRASGHVAEPIHLVPRSAGHGH